MENINEKTNYGRAAYQKAEDLKREILAINKKIKLLEKYSGESSVSEGSSVDLTPVQASITELRTMVEAINTSLNELITKFTALDADYKFFKLDTSTCINDIFNVLAEF